MPYAVVTRAPEDLALYASLLAELGLEAIAMPVTRTEPPRDARALARALGHGFSAILCASARAARALADARGEVPLPEVWAIGPATARVLAAAGIGSIVPPHARDGASLARALIEARPDVRRVLVPRAEDGREDAIEILRGAGIAVEAIDSYRTVAVDPGDPALARGRDALAAGAAVVCVFAPSQVRALDRIAPLRGIDAWFVAIGETTAIALRAAGIAEVAVAESPTPEGMARAVAAVYSPAS
ncbi:MAG: uroporphyrinogen-III synthase [Kofleriaceae bacterium]